MDLDHAPEKFELVALAGGIHSLRSLTNSQTFHPVVGPAAEAQTVHVGGTDLISRVRAVEGGEFVVWDVGLGAAANALSAVAALREAGGIVGEVCLLSFERSLAALDFAIEHAPSLDYSAEQTGWLRKLCKDGEISIPFAGREQTAAGQIRWSLRLGDFPGWMSGSGQLPAPHAIFFDPYSPAVNPEMWTLELFSALHSRLDPKRPCVLTTYTRSTAVRVTLLLAGFYVGVGRSVGEKDETTTATNALDLLENPLSRRWVENKAFVSTNAAPLRVGPALSLPVNYSRNPIANEDYARLLGHPQFQFNG